MTKKKSLAWLELSEHELKPHLEEWLRDLSSEGQSLKNSILFLEGEMGAGKSTFVRELLAWIAPESRSQGSPTFPLVTEYKAKDGYPIYHVDLYRLKSSAELEDSGIEEQIEESGSLVCIEWASLFADSFAHWFKPGSKPKNVTVIKITSLAEKRSYEFLSF
jgi:tRNA threonylcarbamoyl adenosine modification protein YjeE